MQSASKKIFAITALLKAAPPFHRNPSGDQKILAKKLMSARCAEFWEQDARLLFVHLNPIHFNLIIFLR